MSGATGIVVATGDFAAAAEAVEPADGVVLIARADVDEAYEALRGHLKGGEVVLLKGSRGVALERLIPRFEDDFRSEEEE